MVFFIESRLESHKIMIQEKILIAKFCNNRSELVIRFDTRPKTNVIAQGEKNNTEKTLPNLTVSRVSI